MSVEVDATEGKARRRLNSDTPQDLYRWFDKEGNLLYIGISTNAYGRAKQHKTTAKWWPNAANMTVVSYPSREDVEAAEKDAIRTEKPKFNIRHQLIPKTRSIDKRWWEKVENDYSLPHDAPERAEAVLHHSLYGAWFRFRNPTEYEKSICLSVWDWAVDKNAHDGPWLNTVVTVLATAVTHLASHDTVWEWAVDHKFVTGETPFLSFWDAVIDCNAIHWDRNAEQVKLDLAEFFAGPPPKGNKDV